MLITVEAAAFGAIGLAIIYIVGRLLLGEIVSDLYESGKEKYRRWREPEEPYFTSSEIESTFVENIDNVNPLRDIEIVLVDYAFESGGVLFLDRNSAVHTIA